MAIERLDHYNIDTSRPTETIAFYCDVLGCVNGPERRPGDPATGTWLFVNDHPAVHVNFVDDDGAGKTGAIDHVAFEASGYLDTCAQLTESGIEFKVNEVPQIDLMQIFLFDPNQVKIELNIRGECDAIAAARAPIS